MDCTKLLQPGATIKPMLSINEVHNLIYDLYNLKVETVVELNGYDDRNYHITTVFENQKDEYVFKVANSLDSKEPELFDAQNKLQFELKNRGVKCPIPLINKNGEYYSLVSLTSGLHIVRLLQYLKGKILHQIQCTSKIFYEAGRFLAQIDDALQNFSHPAYKTRTGIWMMENVPQLNQFLYAVKDDNRRQLVQQVISEFTQRVLTVVPTLKSGIIHGDFNEHNILVEQDLETREWHVSGIIDFGDSQCACYLFELAIGMTYMIVEGVDVDVGGYVLAGYKSTRTVSDVELNLLKICIEARLCQSLVLGASAILQDPNNTYILSTSAHGWTMLEELSTKSDRELLDRWEEIARNYKY